MTWNFSIDSGLIEYLADGETITATYQITVDDNSVVSGVHDEATSTSQSITITIGSGNARPTITGGPVVVDKAESRDDSNLTATGDLTITDIDRTDIVTTSHSLVVSGTADSSDPAAPDQASLLQMFQLNAATILDATEVSDALTWNWCV